MIPYDSIFVPLSAALGLSITIERGLELAKNLFARIFSRKKGKKIPTDAAYEKVIADLEHSYKRDKLAREVEKRSKEISKERKELKKQLEKTADPVVRKKLRKELIDLEADGEWNEDFTISTVLVEPAKDPDDGNTLRILILQLLGLSAGIIAAHFSGIQLFNSFFKALNQPVMPEWLDFIMTGLLIGGGSGPMHTLVKFVTQNKIVVNEEMFEEVEEKVKEEVKPSAPAIVPKVDFSSDSLWLNIPYKGGVDRDKLEWVHLREKDPDLIVFHHTTMDSRSTFEDVVRIIKDKADSQGNHWLTGYNCVILADGSIHPFCRWDRYGNHAAGNNMNSLGIALNGNFETNSSVPNANADGKLGNRKPTEEQLKSTARVITLWSYLYDIKIDFEKSIIPHKIISSKTCPGTTFPYGEFRRWIEYFGDRWEKSEDVKEKIEAFKLKPYLYIKRKEAQS